MVKKSLRKEDYCLFDRVEQDFEVDVIYLSQQLKWRDSSICAKYHISIETFQKIIREFNDKSKANTDLVKINNSPRKRKITHDFIEVIRDYTEASKGRRVVVSDIQEHFKNFQLN